MTGLTNFEKKGLAHFLQTNDDPSFVIQLANVVTKHTSPVTTQEEATNILILHSADAHDILSKKIVTKEILFKYLHNNNCPVRNNFTKVALIKEVLQYWQQQHDHYHRNIERIEESSTTQTNNYCQETVTNNYQYCTSDPTNNESEFPISVLAKKFAEWFFQRYNQNEINIDDFWLDSQLDVRILTQDCSVIEENQSVSRENVLKSLIDIKIRYGLYFYPSISHEGVQGRLDIHGLALVLICGTLHNMEQCVGVFEAVFSLSRDPFAENNWKIKKVQMLLRNTNNTAAIMGPPSLFESEAMRDILSLPILPNDI